MASRSVMLSVAVTYASKLFPLLLAFGMLVTGSINTLVKKAQFETISMGHAYNHAYFQTLPMFIGEALCIIFPLLVRYDEARAECQGYVKTDAANKKKTPMFSFVFFLPACCDAFATTAAGVALLWINASTWQMLRGSVIIFTALLSVIFLKRKLLMYRWVGVALVVVGLLLVGLSAALPDPHAQSSPATGSTGQQVLGICLTIIAQLVSAIQYVLEEKLVKGKGFTPMQVVGNEGMWGCVIMAGVLPLLYVIPGPANQGGHFENSVDAVKQIFNSGLLFTFVVGYIISIMFYNTCGLMITKHLSTVHRAIIDSLRTGVIWVVDLIIYYTISKSFGEVWARWSWMEGVGFLFLVGGTFVYNAVIRIPLLAYESAEPTAVPSDAEASSINTADDEHAPLLSTSLPPAEEGILSRIRSMWRGEH